MMKSNLFKNLEGAISREAKIFLKEKRGTFSDNGQVLSVKDGVCTFLV